MTRLANVKRLKVHFLGAPRQNRLKMDMILKRRYADGKVNNYKTVENAMIALSHPGLFGPRKVLQLYQKTMGIKIEKPMLAKLKQKFTLRVLLFTNVPTVIGPAENQLTKAQQKTYKKYITKKYPKHRLFWAWRLDVSMGSEEYFASIKDKLMTGAPKIKVWKEIHKICLTDAIFKNREQIAKGYLNGIMVLSYDKKAEIAGAAPLLTRKRVEEKLMIQYRYASNQIDVSKDTMEEAVKNNKYVENECWINSIYDFYHDTLLRPDKKNNMIKRETILQVLGRTEEDIKQGLTVDDVLPFLVNTN